MSARTLYRKLRIENLDTDQIIPKQFLRGIDKSGLAPACCTTSVSTRRASRAPTSC